VPARPVPDNRANAIAAAKARVRADLNKYGLTTVCLSGMSRMLL
jgi:hypothetical protein